MTDGAAATEGGTAALGAGAGVRADTNGAAGVALRTWLPDTAARGEVAATPGAGEGNGKTDGPTGEGCGAGRAIDPLATDRGSGVASPVPGLTSRD